MKKINLCLLLIVFLCMLCGCGKSYTCYDCGKSTTKAYYNMDAKIEKVMCEECARKYWMPMPYQNYRVN
ncbi:MAG: hypothetical protein II997_03885 [Clostridia bacterium]|nr:hypothetical protein [Clostridia bacterium]